MGLSCMCFRSHWRCSHLCYGADGMLSLSDLLASWFIRMHVLSCFQGLTRPYPSLSFVEYNSSHDRFFTPLVYFLAGRYLDPWDAGEGGTQNGVHFWFFLVLFLCFRVGSKIGSNLFIIFGINFGFLFLGSWIFRVSFGSHLGPLEAFLRCVCSQKPLKNTLVF